MGNLLSRSDRWRSAFALLVATAGVTWAGGAPVAVAIVVNKANPVETMTARQLKQIYNGDKARWADGSRVLTMATGAEAPEHKVAIHVLYGMTEQEFQQYVIHANFTGNMQGVPKDFGTSQQVLRFVSLTPGAIGFVRADLANASVKAIKIDGLAPGDEGYPLSGK